MELKMCNGYVLSVRRDFYLLLYWKDIRIFCGSLL
jgi:hypothetical protein